MAQRTRGKQITGILRPDVAIPWTVNQDAGSQKLANLGAPTVGTDAARLQDVQSIPWKQVCKTSTTANIALTGEQTLDGILTSTSRVLVRVQTATEENGIYVSAAGAWTRAADNDSAAEMNGAVVSVAEGTLNADKRFAQTEEVATLGVDPVTWVDIGTGGAAAYPTASNKAMTASVTAADFQIATATTLATTPTGDGMVQVVINGLTAELGQGVKTKDCYFSVDGGTTARAIAAIAAGDSLYWVGSVAGYELDATDRIDFIYTV